MSSFAFLGRLRPSENTIKETQVIESTFTALIDALTKRISQLNGDGTKLIYEKRTVKDFFGHYKLAVPFQIYQGPDEIVEYILQLSTTKNSQKIDIQLSQLTNNTPVPIVQVDLEKIGEHPTNVEMVINLMYNSIESRWPYKD